PDGPRVAEGLDAGARSLYGRGAHAPARVVCHAQLPRARAAGRHRLHPPTASCLLCLPAPAVLIRHAPLGGRRVAVARPGPRARARRGAPLAPPLGVRRAQTAGARRTVQLFPETIRLLRALQPLRVEPTGPVLPNTRGTPIEPNSLLPHWYAAQRALGLR